MLQMCSSLLRCTQYEVSPALECITQHLGMALNENSIVPLQQTLVGHD